MFIQNRFRRMIMPVLLAWALLICLSMSLSTVWAAQLGPQGTHCGGGGGGEVNPPVGVDYCGCTWGEVRFRDRPLTGVVVMLTFQDRAISTTTRLDISSHEAAFFDISGNNLGARAGDIMTLTVSFGDQVLSRPFRGWPDAEGKQRIDLVFPEQGQWQAWLDGGYTRTLAITGDTVWAGGRAGLISASLKSSISQVHTLPWTGQAVTALAPGLNGHIWAVGAGGVVEFDRTAWHTYTVPFSGVLRAVTVEPGSGAPWVGGEITGTAGRIARYSGGWETPIDFPAPVMALAVDGEDRLWVGTWGAGLYRQDGSGGWIQYQAIQGLALHQVLALATDEQRVWVGTAPYISGQNRSGVAQYNLHSAAWQVYTTTHGLPGDAIIESIASIYDIALGKEGTPWLSTPVGAYFLVGGESWWGAYTSTHGLRSEQVTAIAAATQTVVAATAPGLDRLNPQAVPGAPPLASLTAISPPTVTTDLDLTLTGSGIDQDENQDHIRGWNWQSNLDGPLCTASHCVLSASLLSSGTHTISLEVQDDEGVWSDPVTATLQVIERGRELYLPLVLNNR